MKLIYIFIPILIYTVLSCSKEKDNPYDPNANVDFAPINIRANAISPYVIELQWSVVTNQIDKYLIDKKGDSEIWVINIAGYLGNNDSSWVDYNCLPNQNNMYRLYAVAGENTSSYKSISKKTPEGNPVGLFTDNRDGRSYTWIDIGNQRWMAENLGYIPFVCGEDDTCGIYVLGYNGISISEAITDSISNINTYERNGCLYSWEIANEICPDGWHLPSMEEWYQLINFCGGEDFAALKLRENGKENWRNVSVNDATNESGFSALPSGAYSHGFLGFYNWRHGAYYWTSTGGLWTADYVGIYYDPDVELYFSNIENGYSVRCLKDK